MSWIRWLTTWLKSRLCGRWPGHMRAVNHSAQTVSIGVSHSLESTTRGGHDRLAAHLSHQKRAPSIQYTEFRPATVRVLSGHAPYLPANGPKLNPAPTKDYLSNSPKHAYLQAFSMIEENG
jgi:hypothetical protein